MYEMRNWLSWGIWETTQILSDNFRLQNHEYLTTRNSCTAWIVVHYWPLPNTRVTISRLAGSGRHWTVALRKCYWNSSTKRLLNPLIHNNFRKLLPLHDFSLSIQPNNPMFDYSFLYLQNNIFFFRKFLFCIFLNDNLSWNSSGNLS